MTQQNYKLFITTNREKAGAILDSIEELKKKVKDEDTLSLLDSARKAAEEAGNRCDTSFNLSFDSKEATFAKTQIVQHNAAAESMFKEAQKSQQSKADEND